MTSRSRTLLAATAVSVAWCGTGWADDAHEKELERKLAEMQKQIDEMAKQMSDGADRSEDDLEMRIGGLEKYTKKDEDGLVAYWSKNLKMDSADGAFKLSIFGRVQLDFTGWDNDEDNEAALGATNFSTEFRRVRLGAGGTFYKNVEYKAEMDFADSGTGAANFADAYMQINSPFALPFNVRVGHFDEPMVLDRVTSSKYYTFTERSFCEAFAPQRNTGIMLYGQQLDGKLAWFLGGFRDTNAFGNYVSPARPGENNLTARVTGRPYVSESGDDWVHLGVSASTRNPNAASVQFRTRPEVHVGPRLVDTGVMTMIERNNLFGGEVAANFGPFHAQAEITRACLERDDSAGGDDELSFGAESIQVGYFLTGDMRTYDAPMARWNRLKMKKNFGADGLGAVEFALRYSHIDLNDGAIEGGTQKDITLGINWYLNPNTRIMFNWVHFDPDRDVTTSSVNYSLKSGNAFVVRFAVDF